MNEGKLYSAGDVIYKAECMTIFCSMSCNVDMEMNEKCTAGAAPPPPKAACFPSECGKAPAWRIKKIVLCLNLFHEKLSSLSNLGGRLSFANARSSMGSDDQKVRGV